MTSKHERRRARCFTRDYFFWDKRAIMTVEYAREALWHAQCKWKHVWSRDWGEITRRCALRVRQPQTEQLQTLNSERVLAAKKPRLWWAYITCSVQVREYRIGCLYKPETDRFFEILPIITKWTHRWSGRNIFFFFALLSGLTNTYVSCLGEITQPSLTFTLNVRNVLRKSHSALEMIWS